MEKRIFVALKYITSHKSISFLNKIRNEIAPFASLKWVEQNNLHITIQFFGNTLNTSIPIITEAMNFIGNQFSTIQVSVFGIGVFGNKFLPRVLWLGIKPNDQIYNLHHQFQQQLLALCSQHHDIRLLNQIIANNQFTPHITIGRFNRVNNSKKVQEIINNYKQLTVDHWHITQIDLYESIFTPKGPIYKLLFNHKLQFS